MKNISNFLSIANARKKEFGMENKSLSLYFK